MPHPKTFQMAAAALLVLSATVLVMDTTERFSAVAAGSLLLAVALWHSRTSAVLLAAAGLGLLLAALDLRDILPQGEESHRSLSDLALLAATLHAGAAGLAGLALARRSAEQHAALRGALAANRIGLRSPCRS